MAQLFSYGTLQLAQVQLETFGRLLKGEKDALGGYKLEYIAITDPDVIRKSNSDRHPILVATGNNTDVAEGTVFAITDAELAHADAYEVADYLRVAVTLQSGTQAWVYVQR